MFSVYMHINKINHKIYIGQTSQSPELRWGKNGGGYIGCSYFYNAIQKYGWENFEHCILKENLNQDEANYWEKYYIQIFNSTNKEFGYNLQTGGRPIINSNKISLGLKKRWESLENRQNQSQKMKEYYKKLSPEEFEKIQAKKRGKNHANSKAVICKETGDKFVSIKAAADWCGLSSSPGNISSQIKGERKSAGKHPVTKEPLHWYFEQDGIEKSANIQQANKKGTKVKNLETGKIFLSMVDAGKWAGVKNNRICESCKSNGVKGAGKHPETGERLHWIYFCHKN